MDERQNIIDNLEQMKIGVDEPFKFHCTMCGKCCLNREDILLNPRDIYGMAKELGMTTAVFFRTYCETYLGNNSRFPIVRLKPRGSIKRCPLLKDHKCSVHKSKPTVCAMFPIGRCIEFSDKKQDITYVFINPDCGDESETHTVREWLSEFGIPLVDDFYIKWNKVLMKMSEAFRKAEKRVRKDIMDKVWSATLAALYLEYDTDQEFMPQFEENSVRMLTLVQLLEKGGK